MQIKLERREEIDDKRWNGCVHFALGAPPYAYTWFLDNVCEEWVEVHDIFSDADKELKTRAEVLHAESNAIAKLARSTESGDGATMFCTHAPCLQCAKLIYQSGIRELYFKTHYRDETGLTFLKNSTIQVHGH